VAYPVNGSDTTTADESAEVIEHPPDNRTADQGAEVVKRRSPQPDAAAARRDLALAVLAARQAVTSIELQVVLISAHRNGEIRVLKKIDSLVKVVVDCLDRACAIVSRPQTIDWTLMRTYEQARKRAQALIREVDSFRRSPHKGYRPARRKAAIGIGHSETREITKITRELSGIPLILSGVDLSAVALSISDLAGAIWTPTTKWPSDDIAARVRDASIDISPGVYQVRSGTEPARTVARPRGG
jgi:hypothetical protein